MRGRIAEVLSCTDSGACDALLGNEASASLSNMRATAYEVDRHGSSNYLPPGILNDENASNFHHQQIPPLIMKTVFNIKIINHLGACIIAALGLSLVSAIALPTVNLNLSGEIFGQDDDEDSVDLNINSAARRLTAATSYKFSLQGNCAGTGALGSAIKPGTPIKDFIDYVQADASSSLKGTFSNPRGRLPIVLIEKTFSGTKKIRNVGDVWISVTVKGGG